jgi:hypothetical protein
MGDSAVTIIAIFLAAILMFVFPLMTMADKSDDVSQLSVQTATTDFTNKIRTTGYISQEDYDNFILTLSSTGNAYDAEITVQKLDQNPAKKSSGDTTAIGQNVYYTMYTKQVLDSLPLSLTEGDIVSVNVQNTNTTIAGQLRNFMYKVTGNSTGNIVAQESGIVTKTTAN